MFGTFKQMMQQLQAAQRLMKNEPFRELMSHPKVQELFRDPEFLTLVKAQDMAKITTHPKLAALIRDPDVAALFSKINPQSLLQASWS